MIFSLGAQNEVVDLWTASIPNAIIANEYKEIYEPKIGRIRKVKTPTLTIFKPEKPNGTAVVICPGGGYSNLAIKHEGTDVAIWLNALGITAFVLKYRLPNDTIMEKKSIAPLQDAQEAIRYVRRNAQKWQLNNDKIGIMGFSAGGHLAASLSTRYDEKIYEITDQRSAKPNFSILIYPVITMSDDFTHKGSKNKLLGPSPSLEQIELFSADKQVNAQTPPTFLIHAIDDKAVPLENSIQYFTALKKHQISSEIHLYQNGGHGFGLGKSGSSLLWTQQCAAWLKLNLFIT